MAVASFFFACFIILSNFVLLQLVIAVLMEQLEAKEHDHDIHTRVPGCEELEKHVFEYVHIHVHERDCFCTRLLARFRETEVCSQVSGNSALTLSCFRILFLFLPLFHLSSLPSSCVPARAQPVPSQLQPHLSAFQTQRNTSVDPQAGEDCTKSRGRNWNCGRLGGEEKGGKGSQFCFFASQHRRAHTDTRNAQHILIIEWIGNKV